MEHAKLWNKHRVTIPCKRSFDFTWNPVDFMKSTWNLVDFRWNLVDFMKSGRFQVKSTQNLINSDVSTKTIQFDECRRGAMTLDFMKSGVIAPSMHPPKLKSFCWNIWIYKVLGGFHLKSAGFHELWAFVWWSSIGLSTFERPNMTHGLSSKSNHPGVMRVQPVMELFLRPRLIPPSSSKLEPLLLTSSKVVTIATTCGYHGNTFCLRNSTDLSYI